MQQKSWEEASLVMGSMWGSGWYEEGPCELSVAMAMEPWNLTTGAQEWGWGVGTGHAGGREEGP